MDSPCSDHPSTKLSKASRGHYEASEKHRTSKNPEQSRGGFLIDRIDGVTGGNLLFRAGGGVGWRLVKWIGGLDRAKGIDGIL
ncbi:hypothetical protein BOTCAL_0686g00050 [Botryotinia calthae]|uniref:Uncharacterized protein n=1 Tax=Botryotinia calthae TaxID=38488 RepID=A0A4Y8CHU5_9HELO|nr:hypothetical protein BOTCAL_0686g00050 [Botryotinia calthae]